MAVKSLTGFDANNQRIVNVADPTAASDAANKSYVDNVAAGLDWKENVRVASTANITISSPGATINGVTMAVNDRFLAKDQTTASQNGIYVWNGAAVAATRAQDANTSAEITNMIVRASEGTVKPDTMWQLVTDNVTLDTTALVFTEFSGAGATYTADGNGIELTSTTFSIELDGTTLSKSAAGLRIGSGAAGAGLTESAGVLAVGQGTGISVSADAVAVDTSIVVRKFAANCAATTNPQTFTDNLNTLDKQVQVVEVATGKIVLADITEASVNTVTVDFGAAPTASQYRVLVQA